MSFFNKKTSYIESKLCDYIGELNNVNLDNHTKLGFCSGWTVRGILVSIKGTEKFIEKLGQKYPGCIEQLQISKYIKTNRFSIYEHDPMGRKLSCYGCDLITEHQKGLKIMCLRIISVETMHKLITINSDKRYIFIPIFCCSYDVPTEGHNILLIIDNYNNTFNIFDSNGKIDYFSIIYKELGSILYIDEIHKLFDKYLEVYNSTYNSSYECRGYISTNGVNIPSKNSETFFRGNCDMWVFFMMKYINERQNQELTKILNELYNLNKRCEAGILIDNFMYGIAKNIVMAIPLDIKNIKLRVILKNINTELNGKPMKLKFMKHHLKNIGYDDESVKNKIEYYKAHKGNA